MLFSVDMHNLSF